MFLLINSYKYSMSLISRYLVNNRTKLVANVAGFVTEYRPVYQKTISIYKGIDNTLEFQILNPDQKPIPLTNQTAHFVAFDSENNQVIEHTGEVVISNKGLFKIVITENDTLNVDSQYLSYSVYLTDTAATKTLTYADEQLGAKGTLHLSGEAFPGPKNSYTITTFLQAGVDSDEYVSEAVTAQPALNGNDALHTAVFYTNNYDGDILIQATLDNSLNEATNWATIESVNFDGSESQPIPFNFNGVYSYLRFKTSANPENKITKILVRN
jgi:hypothetical protein